MVTQRKLRSGYIRQLRFRVEASEQQGFQLAAELSGLTLSAWVRTTLRAEAERRISNAGGRAPWVQVAR